MSVGLQVIGKRSKAKGKKLKAKGEKQKEKGLFSLFSLFGFSSLLVGGDVTKGPNDQINP
jgi:hypothetical protein